VREEDSRTAQHYDGVYAQPNAFQHRLWIYRPLVRALIRKAGLKPGSSVLDVGCGQGLFSYLFWRCGMRVYGIDVSQAGIKSAQTAYGSPSCRFLVADARKMPFARQQFDCIFARSCSLYNTHAFATGTDFTEELMDYVRTKGVFIFLYNTNLRRSGDSGPWRYHTLNEARQHFGKIRGSVTYFSLRLETAVLGPISFNPLVTRVNALFSRFSGAGGEIVSLVKREGRIAKPGEVEDPSSPLCQHE
jgi:SAM-dependent methyltransferase